MLSLASAPGGPMTLRKSQTWGCSKPRFRSLDARAVLRHPLPRLLNPSPWPHDPAKGWPHGVANWQASAPAPITSASAIGRGEPDPSAAPPNVSGLWLGDYGNGRFETVQIEQDGSWVLATKVTGDANVPAGKPTFRATLVGGEGDGSGHVADAGYTNPRWMPGHLSILSNDLIEFTWLGVGAVRFRRVLGYRARDRP